MRDFAIPALGRTSASIREEAEYSLRRAEAEAHMASGDQNHQRSTSKVLITKPLRCIVKLGGAAITCKNELEMLNEGGLEIVSRQLRQAMMASGSYSSKVLGMDWSKRPGFAEPSCVVDDFIDQQALALSHFIVVHGAGSFGHFQASKSGVHKGGVSQPLVKAGFVATRISIASADLSMVGKAIESGFVPVLHGDAVLDESQGCTILSGDVIIRHLAEHLKPEFIVFLTDVLGVYDRPPTEDNAVLLREIEVYEDGNWSVVKPSHGRIKEQVKVTVASHDTTGGMLTKIAEAVTIAKLGIDVFVVKAGTSHSLSALLGEVRDSIPDDWLGTAFRFQKWNK
ncbi:isopentenyl phosphate kinase isoform X3 [Diospyros lotus]|uniref:isopentenyl phosphate kinase isoform X3 n=1 Tax=Diospyros lotus TaxID=55363 RepID=UPI0022520349|nr:isopentenyl phosphate kinase isoform X3 [Diospyros lotus]